MMTTAVVKNKRCQLIFRFDLARRKQRFLESIEARLTAKTPIVARLDPVQPIKATLTCKG